ncbi:uncharacterized protein [Triticum aestivum]|uniref:uncharacterized protein n=1 Tax=Triticum aestivum TaxID=4565 RepID=UPI001D0239FE|nr:uncharacterized protein LOC123086942 [Triticum aestivum]
MQLPSQGGDDASYYSLGRGSRSAVAVALWESVLADVIRVLRPFPTASSVDSAEPHVGVGDVEQHDGAVRIHGGAVGEVAGAVGGDVVVVSYGREGYGLFGDRMPQPGLPRGGAVQDEDPALRGGEADLVVLRG